MAQEGSVDGADIRSEEDKKESRRTLIVSMITLLLSIPALIGA